MGDEHEGFAKLLETAKEGVDGDQEDELTATYMLAQQIGPILAEGTKGNPRQVKRLLNALYAPLKTRCYLPLFDSRLKITQS